jgi:hypothetical protein
MRVDRYSIILTCIFSFYQSPSAVADDTTARQYRLTDDSAIEFSVEMTWRDDVNRPSRDLSPTITFSPQSGVPFQVLVTPIGPFRDGKIASSESIKGAVRKTAEAQKQQAVEQVIAISEFEYPAGKGYYFSMTDRAPGPGEFKYLTQGIAQVGPISVTFTILTNDGQTDVISAALTMLKSATPVNAVGPR